MQEQTNFDTSRGEQLPLETEPDLFPKMLLAQPLPQVASRRPLPFISIPKPFNADSANDAPPPLTEYLSDVKKQFKAPLHVDQLMCVSRKLQAQFREKLNRSDICMLPAYKDSLPDGTERGTCLALDVGGSGLRVAWVLLNGRSEGRKHATQILTRKDFPIDDKVRALKGRSFFAWMANRIRDTLSTTDLAECRVRDRLSAADLAENRSPLRVGVSWSFPVDQQSKRDALLLQMGKDFRACDNLIGKNLGDLLEKACRTEGFNISVQAVVNDSTSSLLSEVYVEGSTSMAVILGTGLNAAIHLPSAALSPQKFGRSSNGSPTSVPPSPSVVVNTELGMFGKDALATTSWDDVLNLMHSRPDFQPLEHLTSGRYLGEIVRLILVKAIQTAGLFDGEMPNNFGPYSFQTSTMAVIERDVDDTLFKGGVTFSALHPLPSCRSYTRAEIGQIRDIIMLVSDRAAAYMATAIYALWDLKRTTEDNDTADAELGSACISCLGSILGKYPRFRERMQEWLDRLTGSGDATSVDQQAQPRRIHLEMTNEGDGALIGAAVAVALGGSNDGTG